MQIGSIKSISCPFCKKTLYRVSLQQRGGSGDAIWLTTEESPRVEEDEGGNFIECLHCSRRVAMLPDPVHPQAGFYIAPGQQ